ncbi:hypothetical protein [Piscinibacter sp.]|uniref:hypothetical protein n=1 Tax=Piscinibacter sp. TaxID=1903157 RepID=UPI0039E49E17
MTSEEHASTLWRISAFDRLHQQAQQDPDRPTIVSSTLMAEIAALERRQDENDALEVLAACVRLQEPALVYLRFAELVWPVTVFPAQMLYHSPRPLSEAVDGALARVSVMAIEPPAVRLPGRALGGAVASDDGFHALAPVLWRLALHGPRGRLLGEIGGTAAYRVLRTPQADELPLPGALGAAAERLRRESASLKQIAGWPGMSLERAARLLNALYLGTNLMVSRSAAAARAEPRRGLLGWLSGR